MNQRVINVFVISLLTITLFSSLVSANAWDEIRNGVGGASVAISGIFEDLGLGENGLSTLFFSVLLGLIVYTIVHSVFPESRDFVKWGITIAVTGLAIIGIPTELLLSLRNSYGAMGAAILFAIPFMIILAFTIRVENMFIARITWAAFIVYYFILYSRGIYSNGTFFTNSWDILGIVLGIFAFIYLPYIRRLVWHGEIDSLKEMGMRDIEFRGLGRDLERAETRSRTRIRR